MFVEVDLLTILITHARLLLENLQTLFLHELQLPLLALFLLLADEQVALAILLLALLD